MKWKDEPKKPGWYWISDGAKKSIVEVVEHDGDLLVKEGRYIAVHVSLLDLYWAGPIPEPKGGAI